MKLIKVGKLSPKNQAHLASVKNWAKAQEMNIDITRNEIKSIETEIGLLQKLLAVKKEGLALKTAVLKEVETETNDWLASEKVLKK